MMLSESARRRRRHVLTHLVLCGLLVLFIGPFLWQLSTSIKPNEQMLELPPRWIPNPPTLEHYRHAFTEYPVVRYLGNTLLVVCFTTLGTLVSCSLAAYAFARLRWPDRGLVFGLLMATMMVPGQVTMIPMFLWFTELGWIDTFLPLIVPAFFGNAFFIFLLRQFFLTIPEDLLEAARLDGAGELRIFWQIILPLSKPALLTVLIFAVLRAWNDFMGPLIYLTSPENRTLALWLAHLRAVQGTDYGLLMAAGAMMVVPALLLFFVAQRFFIEGIALTGTKA